MSNVVAIGRTQVLVVGGGPIGLALALDLGQRGVTCTLVEQGEAKAGPAKMILVSVRSMEYCRRLGVAKECLNWGFPPEHSLDNVFVTSLTGFEIGRVPMPTMAEYGPSRFSPEGQAFCPQTWFDPILRKKALENPNVKMHFGTRLEGLEQSSSGVRATLHDLNSGSKHSIVADYVIGADGYASTVRRLLGISMRGEEHLDNSINVELSIPNLDRFHNKGRAGRYIVLGPEGTFATFITVDGRDLWRITFYCGRDGDPKLFDTKAGIKRCLGRDDVPYEIKSVGYWVRRGVVADTFRDGRIFLAGDAAHTHPPNGGFGMNTGLGDAENLAWKLAAVLHGWGGNGLLDSYDQERRPACHRAVDESLANYRRLVGTTDLTRIADTGSEGERLRRDVGQRLVSTNMLAWQPIGIHLGVIYEPSSLVVSDDTPKPTDDRVGYNPTARPGSRAPHAWIDNKRSTLDFFGTSYVILRFDQVPVDASSLVRAAHRRGIPIQQIDITDRNIVDLYERKLVLVRPDGYVAWRGTRIPADVEGFIDRICGAATSAACWNSEQFSSVVAAE
jgi:2-polyprenyl-6-methoxyphenol hydroxylase-like FAD-dependent oxidoreductase